MLYAALSPAVHVKPHVQYFEPGFFAHILDSTSTVSHLAKDDRVALRLWEETEQIVFKPSAIANPDTTQWVHKSPIAWRKKHAAHGYQLATSRP